MPPTSCEVREGIDLDHLGSVCSIGRIGHPGGQPAGGPALGQDHRRTGVREHVGAGDLRGSRGRARRRLRPPSRLPGGRSPSPRRARSRPRPASRAPPRESGGGEPDGRPGGRARRKRAPPSWEAMARASGWRRAQAATCSRSTRVVGSCRRGAGVVPLPEELGFLRRREQGELGEREAGPGERAFEQPRQVAGEAEDRRPVEEIAVVLQGAGEALRAAR